MCSRHNIPPCRQWYKNLTGRGEGGGVGMPRCGGGGGRLDHVGQWSRLPAWYLPRPAQWPPDTAHSTTHCCHTASSGNMGTPALPSHTITMQRYKPYYLCMSYSAIEASGFSIHDTAEQIDAGYPVKQSCQQTFAKFHNQAMVPSFYLLYLNAGFAQCLNLIHSCLLWAS